MSQWFTSELNDALLEVLLSNTRGMHDETREKGYFSSASGRPCYLLDPAGSYIALHDIAIALSRYPRWGGRTVAHRRSYSVAQHSVWVSRLCNPEHALVGLLHDASEAFLGDVISPLKRFLPEYKAIEKLWEHDIGRRFGVGDKLANIPVDVKCADLLMMKVERHDLMNHYEDGLWTVPERPTTLPVLVPVDEFEAYCMFVHRYQELTSAK